jgi:hypothetical protein
LVSIGFCRHWPQFAIDSDHDGSKYSYSVADPDPAFHFDAGPDPDPTFHSDADLDPDPAFQFDAEPEPDPTTHFSPDLDPPMLQNDPLRLPPFHSDADPDPAFHFDADPDPAFHFDVDADRDPNLASQKDGDPNPQHCLSHYLSAFVNIGFVMCIGHKIALAKSEVSQITSQSPPHACHNIGPKPHRGDLGHSRPTYRLTQVSC